MFGLSKMSYYAATSQLRYLIDYTRELSRCNLCARVAKIVYEGEIAPLASLLYRNLLEHGTAVYLEVYTAKVIVIIIVS